MLDDTRPGLDIVVVGQSPRPDVELLFAPFVGKRNLRITGALDGLYDSKGNRRVLLADAGKGPGSIIGSKRRSR